MKRAGQILRHLICGFLVLSFFSSFLNADLNNGLVAWYPFDGNASDMSGNGNHGTVQGATLGADRHGHANKAYSFDGVNDYIELELLKGDNFRFAFSNVTLSAWIKTTRSLGTIFGKTLSSWVAPGKAILVYNGYLNYDQCGTGGRIANAPLINDGNWYQVVTVLDNQNNVEFYVDGVFRGNSQRNSEYWIEDAPTHNFYIGTKGNMLFGGNIDDIRLYNRSLSAAEVLALYNLEKPKIPFTDSNFQTAVNLWFSDEANATATYGHISDWNVSAVTNMAHAFEDCTTFNANINAWDVSNVTTMYRMFRNASSFNQPLNDWNTSSVSNMAQMFTAAHSFNQPIGNWDVSSVEKLFQIFNGAKVFNQSIQDWNISMVGSFYGIFAGAHAFNQPIGNWDISSVTTLNRAFHGAHSFNQDISAWNTSQVRDMNQTFKGAEAFDKDISDWNVSSVTNFAESFANVDSLSDANKGLIHESFTFNSNWPHDWRAYVVIDDTNFHRAVDLWFDNQAEANATYGHIRDWNVSAVTNMTEAFNGRSTFNEDLSRWDTSKVKKMVKMFSGCTVFNQSLAPWDLSSVTSTRQMFEDATSFNKPIGNWNVSSVETMHMMFDGADSFNQPLDDWNLSSARVLTWMFREAESFNQNIASWNVLPDVDLRGIFIRAPQFNQDISGLDISSDSNLTWMFDDTSSLSDYNKGKIHAAFSFNPTWPYDWSEFVPDANQSDPPTDNNQTQPTLSDNNHTKTQPSFPDHNQSKPKVPTDHNATQPPAQDNNQTVPSPGDHNATQPPIVDKNQTTIPPVKDSNQTTIDPPKTELIILVPMVATYGHQRDKNGTITLHGKITSDGNGTIEQAGFYILISMDGNDTVLLTDKLSKDGSFSITFSSKESFYFQAFAENEKGTTTGTWKRVGATMLSYPIDGVVETGDGWSTSKWFGDFRYFENGWAYHYGLGWVYLCADGEDGVWLWRKEHGWLWSNQATWPFLWSHAHGDWIYLLIREEQNPVFFDYSTGQYRR